MEAGYQVEKFTHEQRSRPVTIDWWYPVEGAAAATFDYGLGQGRVVQQGAIAPGLFPLVVLSHGAFGAANNYSWLAEQLAINGFVVAGISHFGESYVYGAESIDPLAVQNPGERPLDVGAAISYIEQHSQFSTHIDLAQIGFVGHSSGGATGMQLAGVLFDGARLATYCASADAVDDRGCQYGDSDGASPDVIGIVNYADTRIGAFVVLDPAMGPGFFDYTGVAADVNMLLVGSVENDFLPFRHHAEAFARRLPHVQTHWLNGGEGHFVYLNECDTDLAANGVPLCVDREGVSRAATHMALVELILQFLRDSLG